MIYQTLSATLLLSALGSAQAEPPVAVHNETTSKEQASPEQIYRTAADLLKRGGGDADARKGFELMLKSANQDHLPAIAGIAYLYNVGMGTTKDLTKAIEWFRKAAQKDHAISQFNLGKVLIADQTPLQSGIVDMTVQRNEGLEWLRKAASLGQTDAQYTYGILLMNGDAGMPKDTAKAAQDYLIPAADSGNIEAINALGTLYQRGNGVTRDQAAAEACFRKAAMAGNIKAQANLGEHLDPSSKNESARIEAFAWLFIAEEAKNPYAKKILKNKLSTASPDDISSARAKAETIRQQISQLKN